LHEGYSCESPQNAGEKHGYKKANRAGDRQNSDSRVRSRGPTDSTTKDLQVSQAMREKLEYIIGRKTGQVFRSGGLYRRKLGQERSLVREIESRKGKRDHVEGGGLQGEEQSQKK